jgi:hypothetical protein
MAIARNTIAVLMGMFPTGYSATVCGFVELARKYAMRLLDVLKLQRK